MVSVLIPTKPDDTHAIYVKLALEEQGHQVTLWYTADFPSQQMHSFEFFKEQVFWSSKGVDFEIKANKEFDVVWLRRPRKPVLPDSIHPDDIENARNENLSFFRAFWQVIAPDAFWVNPVNTIKSANCKVFQLKIAAEVGLKTPKTLVSNHPQKIKNFIYDHRERGVVYKTLYPVVWIYEKEMHLTYTKEIKLNELPSDSVLQNSPGVFQEKIPKLFELRVTYFGEHPIAVKIDSQQNPKGILDWRRIPPNELRIENFAFPEHIDSLCRAFMKKLGIVFGCFDFIVTPSNEYYFLEVNEQGQFLWIEEANQEIKMLDAFARFLVEGRSFSKMKRRSPLSLINFKSKVEGFQKRAMELHTKPETFF